MEFTKGSGIYLCDNSTLESSKLIIIRLFDMCYLRSWGRRLQIQSTSLLACTRVIAQGRAFGLHNATSVFHFAIKSIVQCFFLRGRDFKMRAGSSFSMERPGVTDAKCKGLLPLKESILSAACGIRARSERTPLKANANLCQVVILAFSHSRITTFSRQSLKSRGLGVAYGVGF